MRTLNALTKRNIKLFFKDKGMFFTSLITPAILLVLYSTFLGKVYHDSFVAGFKGFELEESLIDGYVGSQIIASILAVSCVTIAFYSNMLMVQDKANRTIKDLTIAPVKSSILAMSYYFTSLVSTLIVNFSAAVICLVYVASVGWYMSVLDVVYIFIDIVFLVMFGTALSSVINFFLRTQGLISAVGTIVGSGYGFICGAYIPISQFSEGLKRVISFLPGTYGTALISNHAMRGAYVEMLDQGNPKEVVESLKDSVDCNIYFFGNKVDIETMYLILGGTIILLVAIYVILNIFKWKKQDD